MGKLLNLIAYSLVQIEYLVAYVSIWQSTRLESLLVSLCRLTLDSASLGKMGECSCSNTCLYTM
jgi:hypothetical protein